LSVNQIKKSWPGVKRRLPYFLSEYKQGKSLLDLAKEAKYSPYLFARFIVEEVTVYRGRKKMLSEAMRDPEGLLGSIDIISEEFRAAECVRPQHQTR
jgi:hypothetical protein